MEKLYEIMGELSEIEFSMESLSCVLESLEEIYELKHNYDMQKCVWIIKMLINSMSESMCDKLEKIDRLILDSRKMEAIMDS